MPTTRPTPPHESTPLIIEDDLQLPDLNGDAVLRALQADPVTAAIPVFMFSADANPRQVERLMAARARAYISKPFDVRDLLRQVEEALAERR